jgi:hypothetical protein
MKKLICVLCGQEWGMFNNTCENPECKGFCTWGYELNKPSSFTINEDGKWVLNPPPREKINWFKKLFKRNDKH